ncbi:MAG: hypothetical protein SWX82_03235 [Cyanobacteriota bacterium]|nr:hypothetical protein [Cyanobacteriota bacterium]
MGHGYTDDFNYQLSVVWAIANFYLRLSVHLWPKSLSGLWLRFVQWGLDTDLATDIRMISVISCW